MKLVVDVFLTVDARGVSAARLIEETPTAIHMGAPYSHRHLRAVTRMLARRTILNQSGGMKTVSSGKDFPRTEVIKSSGDD